MAFIKAHLILLITGVAALLFIVLAVLGMTSDSVVKDMEKRASLGSQLTSLKSTPRNEESIAAEKSRVARLESEYAEVLAAAAEINARTPLKEGVFPTPERAALAYDFCDAYRKAMADLPRGKLAGGNLPSEAEIAEAKDQIAELEERWKIEHGDHGPTLPRVGTGTTPPAGQTGAPPTAAGSGAPGSGDASKDALARARITKARNIRCYVGTDPAQSGYSFSLSPIWHIAGEQPQPADMWYAQVALWIEQDVVAAVAELNDQVADQLPPEEVYVENMPVKRLQTVAVHGYYSEKGLLPFPLDVRTSTGLPQAFQGESFTGRRCNKDFDVVRFTVVAVVDQRALTQLIDAITRQNSYVLISSKYEALGPGAPDYSNGYFYGTAPVARLTLDFEGYMARNVYAKWFPPAVRAQLGIADETGGKGKPGGKSKPPRRRPADKTESDDLP
ncbi:MAG: hypothetical protein KBH81_03490 [Phycisphaerae bacterium]|jgi:hypothetical protein|nr:hypothetical protein [Phycisphaerae bacterium]HOO17602.1 hypothetical protein [Phycisphaerae bacterium]HPC21259.1 hypothetical protein [Phycisphaerae bacterium]HRS27695.1 hypothetical protein [Phycisphaerae bacterium]HRT40860.1 hypothetical protein [Phycisphaerae bacterium]